MAIVLSLRPVMDYDKTLSLKKWGGGECKGKDFFPFQNRPALLLRREYYFPILVSL